MPPMLLIQRCKDPDPSLNPGEIEQLRTLAVRENLVAENAMSFHAQGDEK